MSKFKALKNIVGALCPQIGVALNTPLGGMAANVVAEVLGCEPSPKKIEQAIQNATPDQLLALKKAEQEFETNLKQMDVDVYALEVEDRKNARETFKGDWTPKFIASITIVGFLTYIFMITIYPINEDADDAINLILGYFSGIASAIVSFYYGSSNKKE